jgi:hypothetical protein
MKKMMMRLSQQEGSDFESHNKDTLMGTCLDD